MKSEKQIKDWLKQLKQTRTIAGYSSEVFSAIRSLEWVLSSPRKARKVKGK